MSLLLAILNGVFWSLLDLLRKKTLSYYSEFEVAFTLTSFQFIFFSLFVYFDTYYITSKLYFIYLLPLVLLNTISLYLFLKAIKLSDISLSIPLLSFTPLFTAVYAYFFLYEKLNFTELVGIILILTGVILLYAKAINIKGIISSPINIFKSYSARYMILISLIWSLTPVLDKKSLQYVNISFHGFLQSLGTLLVFTVFLSKNKMRLMKSTNFKILSYMLLLVIVGFLAVIIQLHALKYNNVALLEGTKRALGIILSVFFGYIFFRENLNQQKILGVISMVIGIMLMYRVL